MIRQFIFKEFFENIFGPKFIITFAICAVLILTSIFTGYELYKSEQSWYATAKSENIKALENSGGYTGLQNRGSKTFREPSRLSIFTRGVDSAIGKAATVTQDPNIVLRDSRFGLNPIFAVFGELDLAFIVTIILSLFAILFSYNAVSGERELGTLKLVMSSSVSRASFILGKAIGGLLTLLLPLLIPLLIGLLLLFLVFNVSFSGEEWMRISLMTFIYFLYLAVFYMIGMLMSSLTRNSFVSFLLGLFVWVLSIVIIPKSAVEIAGQISPAPSIDVIEATRATLGREENSNFKELAENYFKEWQTQPDKKFEDLDEKVFDRAREEARDLRIRQEEPMLRDYSRRQLQLLRTAETVTRVSPTSCVTLASNRLARTDAELRERFIESLRKYQEVYIQYAKDLADKNPDQRGGGTRITLGPQGMSISVPEYTIDLPGFPDFDLSDEPLNESLSAIIPDISVMSVYLVLLFGASFVAFLRYDVR